MLPTITSLQNARVKQAVHLRDGRKRKRLGRFLIDGLREIARAVSGGVEIDVVFFCEALCGEAQHALLRQLDAAGATLLAVTPAVYEKVAFGDRAEGIVAVAVTPLRRLDDLEGENTDLIVVLESLEKPGNIGAVLRSADAAGATGVVVTGHGADLYNPNAIRASLGAVFTLPVCHADSQHVLEWLKRRDVAVFAAWVQAAQTYTEMSYCQPCALVLGSEARGLSEIWRDAAVRGVSLPMLGTVDSLNVSVTAAVLLYEALRQRRESGLGHS